ncbi:MAG: acetyltransferase [Methanomicrobium sp.]|nr:acetyltransferase [Methanomicrobium sp.]MDD4299548.1 acetyltransferase [Methanomicrobium sp.]
MHTIKCPVLLVHGWKSNPKIWNELISQLNAEEIPFWNFSHTGMKDSEPCYISKELLQFIKNMQNKTGYFGQFDIICHSLGTSIVRYMAEVLDGESKELKIRQIIAIGPPNQGSAMAELFNHPLHGPEIISKLSGLFVPKRYEPEKDKLVQEIRPGSRTLAEIERAGIRDDVRYRLILGMNKTETPEFFPCFEGKTWELRENNEWTQTIRGDGIIPLSDSYLQGAGYDVFPSDSKQLFPENAGSYCHLYLPQNPEIIKRIIQYLSDPETKSFNYFH